MSNIVSEGGETKLRPPSNLKEFLALVAAAALGLGLIQIAAPMVKGLTFLDETVRESVGGLWTVLIPALYALFLQGLNRTGGDASMIRPDLAPWYVTGLMAAAVLFAFFQFSSFLGGIAVREALAGGAPSARIAAGAGLIALPLCALASIIAGYLLNRHTRALVAGALLWASLAFGLLHALVLWIYDPMSFLEGMRSGIGAAAIGFLSVVGLVCGGAGVVYSMIRGDREIGRLMTAARRLSRTEVDNVTEGVLRRIESRL